MKKYIFSMILLLTSLYVNAQEDSNEDVTQKEKSYKPEKGKFTVALNLGRSTFLTSGFEIIDTQGNVSGQPSYSAISPNENSATNMIGAEGRYFIAEKWAITLSGSFIYSSIPASIAIQAVIDEDTGNTVLPAYNAVVLDKRLNISYAIGALYFFAPKNKKLLPYLGVSIPMNHVTRTLYDPTVDAEGNVSLGAKNLEVTGYGLQAIAGLDYYLTNNFYFGLSIKPVSLNIINNKKYPAPGLYSRKVQNISVSSFVQPLISLGFKL